MMLRQLSVLLAILVLLSTETLLAQKENPWIVNEKSGLTSNYVRFLSQDHYGFMWIGTNAGLNRFDGSQFKSFQQIPGDTNSIMSNSIQGLYVDSNYAWITSQYGISGVNLNDFSIKNIQLGPTGKLDTLDTKEQFRAHILGIIPKGDALYMNSGRFGIYRYDRVTEAVERISFAGHPEVLRDEFLTADVDFIVSMIMDRHNDSILWCGSTRGLIKYNIYNGQVDFIYQKHSDPDTQNGLNIYRRMYQHESGKIFYLNWEGGFLTFDPQSSQFAINPVPRGRHPEFYKGGLQEFDDAPGSQIRIVHVFGEYLYDPYLNELYPVRQIEPNDEFRIHEIFEDRDGRQWIGTTEGIQVIDPLLHQFHEFDFTQFAINGMTGFARGIELSPDGEIMTVSVQGATGLYHRNMETGKWFSTNVPKKYFNGKQITFRGITVLPNGEWIVNAYRDVFMFDPTTYQIRSFPIYIPEENRSIFEIISDSKGEIWMSSNASGLLRCNLARGQMTIYDKELWLPVDSDRSVPILHLFEDSKGNIWFERRNGMGVYLRTEDRFLQFIYDDRGESNTFLDVMDFAEDTYGQLWVGGQGGKLGWIDIDEPEKGIQKVIDLYEGEGEDYVTGILADKQGNIWAVASRNLIKRAPDGTISRFSSDYSTKQFEAYTFDLLPSGQLAIGERGSIQYVDPQKLRKNLKAPIPYLSRMVIKNSPKQGSFVNLPQQFELRHNENDFSFFFSSISYTLPEHNKYMYRLSGFENQWIDAGENRSVTYTNLPSGQYTFELQVANNEGVWSDPYRAASLKIAKAWWNTWVVRILTLLAIIGILYISYKIRIRQIQKQQEIKSELEKKVANVELSALRAQMNPHFIFNSLNSIESFIIKNDTFKAAEYINDFARLMRLILQNSRSHYVNLQDEIEALELYLEMESLRFDNKFHYEIDIDGNLDPSDLEIPPMLIQPFVENAIWHGLMHKREGGKVEIQINRENGRLHCVIQDNGIGRAKAREIRASKRDHGQKSMGMEITNSRVSVINEVYNTNTSVRVRDLEDSNGNPTGTRVEIDIPV